MAGRTIQCFVLKKHFDGNASEDNFELITKSIPPVMEGDFLVEILFLSVDPYMRVYEVAVGSKMIGIAVGRVIESKNQDYPTGTVVSGPMGWCTHDIPSSSLVRSQMFHKIPNGVPPSYALGILGLTGLSAYFGFVDICGPKKGETVLINSAAGAVGNVVGQLALIYGCHVVGCAGSEKKLEYLKELGFHSVFNYKTADLDSTLSKLCPKGIDIFFDNVGGWFFDGTLKHMNKYGRISLCGAISLYDGPKDNSLTGPIIHNYVIPKELMIKGFIASSYYKRYPEFLEKFQEWMKEGKLKAQEHVVEGFENAPKAFLGLFEGANIGKTVVKVATCPTSSL